MIYWRRYGADWLISTLGLTAEQEGIYGRLLDYYYGEEKPLPVDHAELARIARASTPNEVEAVERVVAIKFKKRSDGYHQDRADAEIKLAQQARENGGKHVGKSGKATGSATGKITRKRGGRNTGKPTGYITEMPTENTSETPQESTVNPQPSAVQPEHRGEPPQPEPPSSSHQDQPPLSLEEHNAEVLRNWEPPPDFDEPPNTTPANPLASRLTAALDAIPR